MSDRKMTKEEAIMKAAKDDFDRINALPDSERRQEAIRSIYGGMETFSPPAPVSIDDKVHAVSLASEVPGHEKRGVIGHYKIHHNGDREGTVLGNWDWERVVADAGLTGKWMVLNFTDANDFERDWSMLDATQDSLREHSKLLKQRDSQINDLRAEVAKQKAVIDDLNETIRAGSGKTMAISRLTEERDNLRAELSRTKCSLSDMAEMYRKEKADAFALRAEVEALKLELDHAHVDRALAESEVEELKRGLNLEWPLDKHLQGILGRPCFDCAQYAPILRALGWDIPQKAEAEQAAVIAWMLGHYRDDPDNWTSRIADDIDKAARLRERGE